MSLLPPPSRRRSALPSGGGAALQTQRWAERGGAPGRGGGGRRGGAAAPAPARSTPADAPRFRAGLRRAAGGVSRGRGAERSPGARGGHGGPAAGAAGARAAAAAAAAPGISILLISEKEWLKLTSSVNSSSQRFKKFVWIILN